MKARLRCLAGRSWRRVASGSVIRSLLLLVAFSGEIARDDGQCTGEKVFIDAQLTSSHRFWRAPSTARHHVPTTLVLRRDVWGRLELVILDFRGRASSYAAISPLSGAVLRHDRRASFLAG